MATKEKPKTTEDRIESIEQSISTLAATMQEFGRKVDQRFALMESTSSPLVDQVGRLANVMDDKLKLGNRQQRTQRRAAEHVLKMSQVEVDIMTGLPTDHVYRCRISTEPRSEILVAAQDHLHAEDKFKRFYGITSFIDGSIRVIVDRCEGEITPELIPPRQTKALKTLEDQKQILADLNLRA